MVDGIGVGLHRGAKDGGFEAAFDAPVVGGEVLVTQGFLGTVAEDQSKVLRVDALQARQLLGVGATLEDRRWLRLVCELGVGHLVAEAPPKAGPVDPKQEVGMTPPAPVKERGLVDDLRSPLHGADSLFMSGCEGGQTTVGERELHYPA